MNNCFFNKENLFFCFYLTFIFSLNAQWKTEKANKIYNEITISYDVIYEKELTAEQKKDPYLITDISVTFNKNKLIKRRFYNDLKLNRYLLLDYENLQMYSCTVSKTYKSAISSEFRNPKTPVLQTDETKEILGFPCNKTLANIKGKEVEIYTTPKFGLRQVDNYDTDGFLLEYTDRDKFGYYKVIARNIQYHSMPEAFFSLDGFRITTREAYKESLAASKKKTEERNKKNRERIDTKAPSFKARTMDNHKLSTKNLKGKVIVMNFWFTGCSPCRQEIPQLNKLQKKYKDKEVVFVAVALDAEYKLDAFLKETPFEYQMIADGRYIANKFEVTSYPTNIVLDTEGNIQTYEVGYKHDIIERLSYKIDKFLE